MNEEDNKVTRITVDLSTTVKPIAISEEDALKKLEEDNKTQAQYKDDVLDNEETTQEASVEETKLTNTQQVSLDAMKEANKSFDQEAFNKANEVMGIQTPEERKKQTAIILAIIIGVILLILLVVLQIMILMNKAMDTMAMYII